MNSPNLEIAAARQRREMKGIRQQFGETMVALATDYPDFIALTADLMYATGIEGFGKLYPNRLINVGVAEQNMAGIAAGLALCGKLPIVCGYAAFTSLRAVEQAKVDVAYNGVKVILAAQSAGLSYGVGGPTHQTHEDVAIMRAIPNTVVLVPSDAHELDGCMRAAMEYPAAAPIYIRLGRGPEYVCSPAGAEFVIGQAVRLRDGDDLCLVANGAMTCEAVLAADCLAEQGISTEVLNLHTVKPLDAAALRKAASRVRAMLCIEEHSIHGGLGAAVLEVLAESRSIPIRLLGIPDRFPPIGPTHALRAALGLCAENIVAHALSLLAKTREDGSAS